MNPAEMNWERIVAIATPSMPICSASTKKRSRKIFNKLVRIRKRRGRMVSPTARRIPLPML